MVGRTVELGEWGAQGASLAEGVILVGIDEATALAGPPWQVLGPGEVTVYRGEKPLVFREGETLPL